MKTEFRNVETFVSNGKEFIISVKVRRCGKLGYYAHYIGELTQFGKVFNTGERKAHRVNPSYRANKRWSVKPFNSIDEARVKADIYSRLNILHF